MQTDILVSILRNSTPLGEEYAEIALDRLLNDESLKQVPVVKTIMSVYNLSKTISDTIFLRKLIGFIYNIQDISVEEREEFIKRYIKDDKNFTEKLIYTIDSIDDTDKCKYLASIFKCYGRCLIDYSQLKRYFRAIKILSVNEIMFFKEHVEEEQLDSINGISLFNAGLGNVNFIWGGVQYSFSEEGFKFIECAFKYI